MPTTRYQSAGVIQIPFNFKMRFEQPNTLQNQFYANGGDLKFVRGGMKLLPQSQGTLFQITSSMKIHDQAPFTESHAQPSLS